MQQAINRNLGPRHQPQFSIVTICKDDIEGLRYTLQSTSHINRRCAEQVVVDGHSRDGTLELLQDPTMRVSKWISESDSGIAEAFNKGVALGSGDYVLFLNAGDTLVDGVLESLSDTARRQRPELIIGDVLHVDTDGRRLRRLSCRWPLAWQKLRNYWPHQGMLIRRDLFSQIGTYDLDFSRAGMDYEWSLRYLRLRGYEGISVTKVEVARMVIGGVSMTDFPATFRAYHRARMKHNVLPRPISWLVTEFFIIKRRLGDAIRGFKVRNGSGSHKL